MYKKGFLGGFLLAGMAFALFMTMYPPARSALAQSGITPTSTYAGHGIHSCNAGAPLDPIDGVLTAGGKPLVEIMIGNFSPTPVFLTSTNGNPAAQGWPICSDPLLCASAVSLPVFGSQLSCSPTVGIVDVRVFGVR